MLLWAFGLAPLSIVFVNTYTQNYSLVRWPSPKLLLFTLGTRTFVGRTLSPLTMQVASMPLGLVLTQALLISCSTHLSKLLYFQKAAAVVTIIDPMHIKDCEEQRKGSICTRQIEYSSNRPLPTFPQSSVQKEGGGVYFWELTVCKLCALENVSSGVCFWESMFWASTPSHYAYNMSTSVVEGMD